MEQNPYESPRALDPVATFEFDLAVVTRMVRGPAIALAVLAVIAMLLDFVVIANVIISDAPLMLAEYGREQGIVMIVINVVGNGLLFIVHLVVFRGAINIYKLNSYSGALTAAILALIPFCSPVVILGIPIGIWAIVVLQRGAVRTAFRTIDAQKPCSGRDVTSSSGAPTFQ